MKYCLSLIVLLLLSITGFTQKKDIPRDTSYSIRLATQHLQTQFPYVTAIQPDLPKCVLAKTNLVYANLDGRELHLDVFYPKKKRKKMRPGVLLIFGGGWTSGTKENQVPMAQQLAKKGYVAVAVEYRLSPEAPYPAGVHDLKAAIRWMRANALEFGLDTSKIATLGCSAGAHLASLLGTTGNLTLLEGNEGNLNYGSQVQAVLNIDGIVSFIHPEAEPEWTGKSANKWLGSYTDNFERWKEASPLEYAGKDSPPFLFVNSSSPRFHAGRDDLIKLLNSYGTYSEVHTLEGSPHSFWLVHPWFEPTLKYSLDFLKKVFK